MAKLGQFKIPDADLEVAIELYRSGIGLKRIGERWNTDAHRIRKFLLSRGVKMRGPGPGPEVRKYSVNQSYFDVIDNEEKAYILGLLASDGCVIGNSIAIKLKSTDAAILEKIKLCWGYKGPLHFRTHPPMRPGDSVRHSVELKVTCKHMAESLAKYHIVPNKTFTVKPPDLRPDLMRHYWRGCVDGDGCIYIGNCRSTVGVNLIGTYEIVAGFRDFVTSSGLKSRAAPHPKGKIWVMSFGGWNNALFVGSLLYKDSFIYLDRKFLKFKAILDGGRSV